MTNTCVNSLKAEYFATKEEFERIQGIQGASSAEDISRALQWTVPKPVGRPLIRIGGRQDGAYLLPDDFAGVEACFSPGTNNRKTFEDELLQQYGIDSYMIDYSSDPEKFRTPLQAGRQFFQKKWLEPITSEISISLADWISQSVPTGHNFILQMDIEGAEWRNLLTASDDILSRFRMLIVELHQLNQLASRSFLEGLFVPIFERLNRTHVCAHAHPNNYDGFSSPNGVAIEIPQVMELTFLRRDRILDNPIPVHIPHPLDVINVKRKKAIVLGPPWAPSERSLEAEVAAQKCELHNLHLEIEMLAKRDLVNRSKLLFLYDEWMRARDGREDGHPHEAGRMELAKGKPFTVSSRYRGTCILNAIETREPFFFHTNEDNRPSITIDLEGDAVIEEIVITNRTDAGFDRCKGLFVDLLDELDLPGAPRKIPAFETPEFMAGAEPNLSIRVGGVRARYVRIYSALRTYLHFSDLRVYGSYLTTPDVGDNLDQGGAEVSR